MPSPACECELSGYCSRHGINKNKTWHKLCQTQDKYRTAWDSGSGPGQVPNEPAAIKERKKKTAAELLAKYHDCWDRLHRYAIDFDGEWSAEAATKWLAEWEKTIPRAGCQCQSHWQGVKKRVPPAFATAKEFWQWTVDAHNEVNRLLGKPNFTPAN